MQARGRPPQAVAEVPLLGTDRLHLIQYPCHAANDTFAHGSCLMPHNAPGKPDSFANCQTLQKSHPAPMSPW